MLVRGDVHRADLVRGVLHLDEAPVLADAELVAPALIEHQGGVEELDDSRVLDGLVVVPPAQVLVEADAAVLARVPALAEGRLSGGRLHDSPYVRTWAGGIKPVRGWLPVPDVLG